jgi:hypothetical protein
VGDEVFVLRAGDTLMARPHQLRNSGNVEYHYLLMLVDHRPRLKEFNVIRDELL